MATIYLNLYTTSHCHLCEQAESLLRCLALDHDLQWSVIDIAENADLLADYELKIPVLHKLDTGHELCWPFSKSAIVQLISYIQCA